MQLWIYRRAITAKQDQLRELYELASSGGAINYDAIRVQSSSESGMPKVEHYVDIENEIKADIRRYMDIMSKIIEMIKGMRDERHMQYLYCRFVDRMSAEKIAKKMHYSISGIYKVQRRALEEFGKQYETEIKVWRKRQKKRDMMIS